MEEVVGRQGPSSRSTVQSRYQDRLSHFHVLPRSLADLFNNCSSLLVVWIVSLHSPLTSSWFHTCNGMGSRMQASSLNNHGVALLISGQSSFAMRLFQRALVVLQECTHGESPPNANTDITLEGAGMPLHDSVSLSELQDSQSFSYIYDHGILIVDSTQANNETTISLYSAVILFNSALASHRKGRLARSEASLKKALLLYEMCGALLKTTTAAQNDMSITTLILLALNNKAHIHHEQLEYAESQTCLAEISDTMSAVECIHSTLRHVNVEAFILNVMLMGPPTTARAA